VEKVKERSKIRGKEIKFGVLDCAWDRDGKPLERDCAWDRGRKTFERASSYREKE
jgi:hypothetical protein